MNMQQMRIERKIRIAGVLLLIGLLVELVTLRWSHPTAFLFFLLLGGGLIVLGISIYLLSVVSTEDRSSAVKETSENLPIQ
jgi:hypothetical protein